MDTAQVLLEEAMQWLQAHYTDFRFTVERDVVWTLQRHIALRIEKEQLPLAVFNDYPLIAGTRRSKSTDLALLASPFVLPKGSAAQRSITSWPTTSLAA